MKVKMKINGQGKVRVQVIPKYCVQKLFKALSYPKSLSERGICVGLQQSRGIFCELYTPYLLQKAPRRTKPTHDQILRGDSLNYCYNS